MKTILLLASTEIREALRNRWVLAATALLAVLALTLAFLGSAPTGTVGAGALDVVVISLASLTIFIVPLIALLNQSLIAGTVAVYGKAMYRELYDEIVPVDAGRVVVVADGDRFTLGSRTLEILDTPGHARHHYSAHDLDHDDVFSGDTFGISYRELDTEAGPFIFPTTTPVQFDPAALHSSIDRLMARVGFEFFINYHSASEDVLYGTSWQVATLADDQGPWAWRLWSAEIELPAGRHQIVARAFDSAGQTQPSDVGQVWNFKGYMNNAWSRVAVEAVGG